MLLLPNETIEQGKNMIVLLKFWSILKVSRRDLYALATSVARGAAAPSNPPHWLADQNAE